MNEDKQSADMAGEARPGEASPLAQVRAALITANEQPGGPITDTIWMPSGRETLMDFIDAALSSAAPAPVAQVRGTSMAVIEAYASAVAGDQSTGLVPADVLASRKAAAQAVADLADSSAPAPVLTQAQPLTRELVREVTADAQEVFQAGSSDTLQVVRDVIEYFSASLKARIDRAEATGHGASKT